MHSNFRKNKALIFLHYTVLIGISVYFLSCKTDKKQALENVETLVPQAKRVYKKNVASVRISTQHDTLPTRFSSLFSSFSGQNEYSLIQQKFYIDRFGPKESWKIILLNDSSSSTLSCWSFSDSLKNKNAFFNWLDCFGKDCQALKVGERKLVKEYSGEIWLQDTLLIYWKSENGFLKANQEKAISNFLNSPSIRFHLKWKKGHYTQWLEQ